MVKTYTVRREGFADDKGYRSLRAALASLRGPMHPRLYIYECNEENEREDGTTITPILVYDGQRDYLRARDRGVNTEWAIIDREVTP